MVYAFFAAFRKDVDYKSYIEYSSESDFGVNVVHKFNPEEIQYFTRLAVFFEVCFLFECGSQFVTSYNDNYNRPVRDLKLIYQRYLKG